MRVDNAFSWKIRSCGSTDLKEPEGGSESLVLGKREKTANL